MPKILGLAARYVKCNIAYLYLQLDQIISGNSFQAKSVWPSFTRVRPLRRTPRRMPSLVCAQRHAKADIAAACRRCNKPLTGSQQQEIPREKTDELFTTHAFEGIRCVSGR